MAQIKKHFLRARRAHRTRARLHGTAGRPRLSVFRSAKHFTAQLIDDDAGKTLASVHDKEIEKGTPLEKAQALGKLIADKSKKAGVETLIFDRGSYAYHGRVKAFAEGAREGGLKF
ncbi:50S ribosomal protein L18 [Candidatus Uhrbacteria bacterium]|jgi:large subunit ribosomal protein L18|nr:50S ribosomal protein L18 [Candidatus Uhrbacteria bacterium]HJN85358.1 50S ribosomal protein L18 [Patescibacteria group bacterium]